VDNPPLTRIEKGYLLGSRPRNAGSNARLGEHGLHIREPFARLYFEDGSSGFGFSRVTQEQAEALLGSSLTSLEDSANGLGRSIEFPLWDALGQRAGQPVYRLLTGNHHTTGQSFSVPCYDTTLYFDDLHLTDDDAAVAWMLDEMRAGYERGHRAFKLKIGRGAMHMPLVEGTQRDIAIIRGIRAALGPGLPLMIDANNGFNVNLVKRVLTETVDCDIYWLEEPFHEDRVLYENLHTWMTEQGLHTLIADGEGQASPDLMNMAHDGMVNVVQYNLLTYGFANWLNTGRQLDTWGVKSAPHNYGSAFGSYATCHLAGVLEHFAFVEWDHIDLDGLDTSNYAIREGRIHVPDSPGFGLHVDETVWAKSVKSEGFTVS
jgi:L-rhamnonate dehydratase